MKNKAFKILDLPFNYCFFLLLYACLTTSCKKDSFIDSQNAQLSTSVDSLKYDTVFTSVGSITQSFKISNLNNQKLLLNTVKLMNGTSSSFKINISGNPVAEATNIEVAANDSIYVFVTAQIDPNLSNLPFIVKDSILISFNGNKRFVQLEAYGQNANFLRSRIIKSNTVWSNKLPYVILGSIQIDAAASLTIEAGCKIFSHANVPFIVDGNLVVNGTRQQPVIFSGDRLDADYKDLPYSWAGIYFTSTSNNNILTHTVIKNAFRAIVVEKPSVNTNPKLILHQCIIDNAFNAGLLCVNSSIQADNCLITNCGYNVSLSYGGNYNFTNCTVAGYSTNFISHKNPVLAVSNFASSGSATVMADLNAVFRNCIFWGDNGIVDNEVIINKQGNNVFSVIFDHCLYKSKVELANSNINASITNENPLFDKIDLTKNLYDFHISSENGPGINKGVGGTGFAQDMDGNNRVVGIVDLGCYEKQ